MTIGLQLPPHMQRNQRRPPINFGGGLQNATASDYADAGRSVVNFARAVPGALKYAAFGPDGRATSASLGLSRNTVDPFIDRTPAPQADLMERFTRDNILGEQERDLGRAARLDGRNLQAAGWYGMGVLPFTPFLRSLGRAGRAASAAPPPAARPKAPPLLDDPFGPMPSPAGPQPRPRPSPEDTFARLEAQSIRAKENAARQAAEQRALLLQRQTDNLGAMGELQTTLTRPYQLELPQAAAMGQRTGPLADLRMSTGSNEVISGTRPSIHDFRVPFDQALELPFSQRMAAPFREAGLIAPAQRARNADEFLGPFKNVDGTTGRTASPYEIRQAEEALNDLIPSFQERFVERAPGVNSLEPPPRFGTAPRYPFAAQTSSYDVRVPSAINQRARAELLEEVSAQIGRAPFNYANNPVDNRALQQMIEAIESGTVSSRMYPEGLEYLLRTGEAPTAFRTGRTSAGESSNMFAGERRSLREATEFGNFGVPLNADASARPYYGYIQGQQGTSPFPGSNTLFDKSVSNYGPVTAQFSDAVRANSSFTLGDSLNMMIGRQNQVPRPLSNPTPEDILFAGGGRRAGVEGPTYAEVQMFGGPRPQDLSSLMVSSNYADKIKDLLKRYNVDVPVTVDPKPWISPLRP